LRIRTELEECQRSNFQLKRQKDRYSRACISTPLQSQVKRSSDEGSNKQNSDRPVGKIKEKKSCSIRLLKSALHSETEKTQRLKKQNHMLMEEMDDKIQRHGRKVENLCSKIQALNKVIVDLRSHPSPLTGVGHEEEGMKKEVDLLHLKIQELTQQLSEANDLKQAESNVVVQLMDKIETLNFANHKLTEQNHMLTQDFEMKIQEHEVEKLKLYKLSVLQAKPASGENSTIAEDLQSIIQTQEKVTEDLQSHDLLDMRNENKELKIRKSLGPMRNFLKRMALV